MLFLDYYYIWAAAHIALSGGNPYDAELLAQTMYAAGYPADKFAPMFSYPIWALSLFLPFGALSFWPSLVLWTSTSVVCCGVGIRRMVVMLPKLSAPSAFIAFSVITFFPLWKLLVFGQSTFFVLFGAVLVTLCIERKLFPLAGLGAALMLAKPHLVVVAMLYLLLSLPRGDAVKVATWAGGGILLLSLLLFASPLGPWALFLHSWTAAATHTSRVPFDCSLASLVSAGVGFRDLLSLLMVIAASLVAILIARKGGWNTSRFLTGILPLSLLAAPFSWSHDYLLLLPAYLVFVDRIFIRYQERAALIIVTAMNVCMATLVAIGIEAFIGLLPVLLFVSVGWKALMESGERATKASQAS